MRVVIKVRRRMLARNEMKVVVSIQARLGTNILF